MNTDLCLKCGNIQPPDNVLGGRCPRCMLELGFEASAESSAESIGGQAVAVVATIPISIGRYRIIRVIGEGGMGVVYEAEQEQPRRTVALKIIRPGMATSELLRRFEQEAEALGRLQHPGIAHIYEAGTLDTGLGPQPYFAMEIIRGRQPREYAEDFDLTTRQRFELMEKICEAVHHAHQRGLIHRDLKPANILVDDTGQPKILDFGVARVTDSDARATLQTDMGQLVGTLAYMSPEQALADPLELDTRTDVYALGVILFELLTGRLPNTISRNLPETLRQIREGNPVRLGTLNRVYRGDVENIVGKALEKNKTRRYQSATGLAMDIGRFLRDEPIAARSPSTVYQLQKLAHRNKALFAGIAAVFVALFAGLAVATVYARTAAEQARMALGSLAKAVEATRERDVALSKLQETNEKLELAIASSRRAEQITAGALSRANAAGVEALRERDRAIELEKARSDALARGVTAETKLNDSLKLQFEEQQRAASASATARLLGDLVRDNLLTRAGSDKTVPARAGLKSSPEASRKLLDSVSANLNGLFDTHPVGEANVREALGAGFVDLRLFRKAESQLLRALEVRIRVEGETHPHTLETLKDLAVLRIAANYVPAANSDNSPDALAQDSASEANLKNVIDKFSNSLGEKDPTTLAAMDFLARWYSEHGRFPEEASVRSEIVDRLSSTLGETDTATTGSMVPLIVSYEQQNETGKATELSMRLEAAMAKEPDVVMSLIPLIAYYEVNGKKERAIHFSDEANEVFRSLGDEDPTTRTGLRGLWAIYFSVGKFAEAEAVAIRLEEFRGDSDLNTLEDMLKSISIYERRGKSDLAGERWKSFESRLQAIIGVEPGYKQQLGQYARNANIQGVFDIRLPQKGDEKLADVRNLLLLGATYGRLGIFPEAEKLLIRGMDVSLRLQPQQKPFAGVEFAQELVTLYQNWGNPEKAYEWQTRISTLGVR